MAAQKHIFAAADFLLLFEQQPAYFYARLCVENLPRVEEGGGTWYDASPPLLAESASIADSVHYLILLDAIERHPNYPHLVRVRDMEDGVVAARKKLIESAAGGKKPVMLAMGVLLELCQDIDVSVHDHEDEGQTAEREELTNRIREAARSGDSDALDRALDDVVQGFKKRIRGRLKEIRGARELVTHPPAPGLH